MQALRISEEAMAALQAHDWPGNVRQLRNIIERTIILAPGDRVSCIDVDLLPREILDNQNTMRGSTTAMAIMGSPLREARESFERDISNPDPPLSGNISRTASFIGMERSALHRKLEALGIGDKTRGGGIGGANGSAIAEPAGSFPEQRAPRQAAGHHFPGEGREATGRDHLVRRLLHASSTRRRVAAGLQASDFDHHASELPPDFVATTAADGREGGRCRTCFLTAAAQQSERMTLFLVNGVMLQGSVTGFDQFSVVLERGGQIQLVYKHALSTLQPAHALDLGAEQNGEDQEEQS